MTIDTKYDRLQKVKIRDLECTGLVIGFYLGRAEIEYQVRYFDKAEAKTVYFYEWELEPA